ncbi:MAG: UbiD family decarboxylase, partial [Candidatus Binatia bacterium]|nr:UbiD family decarboxylase [Candidatus Binatia bacterium]
MPYRDLREWLTVLDREGELVQVKDEVDWNLEAGAIIRRVCETDGPAVLLNKIKDYPKGYRIFGAPFSLSRRHRYARLALALDLPVDTEIRAITEEYIKRRKTSVPPAVVESGPCQQNVLLGDDVDLLRLPAPMIHDGDGGRYIGTWHTVITRDPETGWVNYGMYRLMIHDRDHLGGLFGPIQHFMEHLRKHRAMGKPMEFAVAIGTEPVTALISCSSIQGQKDETEVIGAMRGEPLELVPCKTVDLKVPATSEIVLEGFVNPEELKEEGPFGEYTGYMVSERLPRPVFNVTAMTHRNDPILTMTSIGVPVDEDHVIMPVTNAAEVLQEVRDIKGYPVKFIYVLPESANHFWVVSTKVPDKTYPRRLAMAIWGTKPGRMANYLLVLNDDVDITDVRSVIWAMSTRVHPVRGVLQIPHAYTSILVPFMAPEEREKADGAYMLLDGTWPTDWPESAVPQVSSFSTIWPKEIRERVLKRWNKLIKTIAPVLSPLTMKHLETSGFL